MFQSYAHALLFDLRWIEWVTMDGIDLKDFSFETLSHIVGGIKLDPVLLNASIEENLRFARPEASRSQI